LEEVPGTRIAHLRLTSDGSRHAHEAYLKSRAACDSGWIAAGGVEENLIREPATLSKVLCNIQQLYGRPAAFLAPLRAAGFDVVLNEKERLLSEAELIERLPGAVATIAGGEPYTERVFAAAPELRVVARFGVGYDRVDVAAATRHGVAVAMAFGTNHESVADYAFALAIGLAVELLPHHVRVAGRGWGCSFHPGLWGRCIGIVGLGRIGKAMARRASAFAMRVLAADPLPDRTFAAASGIELVPLDELLRTADVVSLHTPLAPETRHLIGRRELALMKPGAFVINTARGGLIDEAALYEALAAGRLAGAGLDVFEAEPPEGSPLLDLPNVLLAPHAAGMDEAAERLMGERCVASILAIHRGQDPGPGYVLNPEVLSP
jgi:D-3-phosphoglycerate dehydrogenase / 2-oxoglutarate reductase